LSTMGPHLCAIIELGGPEDPLAATSTRSVDPAAAAEGLCHTVLEMQVALTDIELSRHGGALPASVLD